MLEQVNIYEASLLTILVVQQTENYCRFVFLDHRLCPANTEFECRSLRYRHLALFESAIVRD